MASPPDKGKGKHKRAPKSGLERAIWIGLIVVCVLGMFLCGAMIPAFLDDPVPLIVMAGFFAAAAFAAASQL